MRTDVEILCALAARLDDGALVLVRSDARRCSTSCGAPAPAGLPTTRASPTSGSTRRTASSGPARPPTTRARRACSPIASRRRAAARAFTPSRHRAAGGRARRRLPAVPDHRPGAAPITSRARRRGASRELASADARAARGNASGDRAARRPGRRRHASRSRRGAGRRLHVEADADHREDTVFVPFHWGGDAVGQPPDQSRRSTRQPDARIQGVRGRGSPAAPAEDTDMSGKRRLVVVGNGMAGARLVEEVLARGGARRVRRSPCSATSRTATTTASCSRACWPAATSPRTSSQPAVVVRAQRRDAARRRARRADRRRRHEQVRGAGGVVEPYDTLVIATGSRPLVPPIDGCRAATGRSRTASSSSARWRTASGILAYARSASARGRDRRRAARPRGGAGAAEPRASMSTSST